MEPINRYLDAAVLKPEMTQAEARAAILESVKWKTKTVCVRPCDIQLAKELTKGSDTGVSCVLAFPHGNTTTAVKKFEAEEYIRLGTDEIDMVANYGMIRSANWDYVENDIRSVAQVCEKSGVTLKVIFETCYLTSEEIEKTVEVCVRAGADFVKTSTGFASAGASMDAVACMINSAKGRIKVKPSGGIRDRDTALAYVKMGAHRLGTNYAANETLIKGEDAQTGEGKKTESGY